MLEPSLLIETHEHPLALARRRLLEGVHDAREVLEALEAFEARHGVAVNHGRRSGGGGGAAAPSARVNASSASRSAASQSRRRARTRVSYVSAVRG